MNRLVSLKLVLGVQILFRFCRPPVSWDKFWFVELNCFSQSRVWYIKKCLLLLIIGWSSLGVKIILTQFSHEPLFCAIFTHLALS
jgi:hypothetical protein